LLPRSRQSWKIGNDHSRSVGMNCNFNVAEGQASHLQEVSLSCLPYLQSQI